MNQFPIPVLGTAMWGWTVPRAQCFEMLSHFYETGFREVDTATNYPIDKNPQHFRLSEKILLEWIKAHEINDLKVMMKVGSLNNMMTPDQNLSKSFLLILLNEYRQFFTDNLDTFMIHWDNRSNPEEIRDTYEALEEARNQGLRIGLSGIKHPELYEEINKEYQFSFRIQAKHNILQSAIPHYQTLKKHNHFIVYGINAGGIKLEQEKYKENSSLAARGGNTEEIPPIVKQIKEAIGLSNVEERPKLSGMNHCGLTFAYYTPGVSGILLGTSKLAQLKDSLHFMQQLEQYNYTDFYQRLRAIHEGKV